MEIQQSQSSDAHWNGRSQQETNEKPLAYQLFTVAHGDEQHTGFTAVLSIIEKDGDSKCVRCAALEPGAL